MRRAFCTIVTRNYAPFAQVLLAGCRRAHPEVDLFVCYVDPPPPEWREAVPGTRVLHAAGLGIPDWRVFAFQYTPFELACAIKPHVVGHLLHQGYDEVVYLDGDMAVYGPLAPALEPLAGASLVITPHLLVPLPDDDRRPHEQAFLASGTYNAGFFALRNDDTAWRFLAWWKAMVRQRCVVDLASSLFVDQKWLDLVPGLFPSVHLLREPGCNVGHWSLSQFRFEPLADDGRTRSGVAVGGAPLVLFHFSGMTPGTPDEYLRSQTRTSLAAIPVLDRLVRGYHAELQAAGLARCAAWGCEFDRLSDGTPIHPAWREAVRRREPGVAGVADPFDVAARPDLPELYRTFEAGAVKWRRDWRLRWPRERGLAGQVRKANGKLKRLLLTLRGVRRSA